MYSCANYPRGCRGRANIEGGKCADCVVCSLSDHACWTKTNILPEPQTSSPIGSLIALCAAQGLSQSAPVGDPERLSIQGNPPWIMRQTTKEKQRQWQWAHRRSSRLDWNNVLGPVPSELLSCLSPHCFRYNDLIFSSTFLFFRPHYGFYYLLFDLMHRREFLISVIRLTYSEGGIYLLVCLFACFLPKINSRIDSAFRFDMVRQSETSIYYGVNFYYKNETKNTKTKKKRIGSARLISQRTGYHGLFIGSDLLLASSELGWLGLISWWMVDIRFGLSCLLACLRDFLISWLNMLAALLLSFALGILLHICPRFHRFVPTYPDPVYYLRYYCSIPMYLTYY